jgi:integrase
LYLAEVERRGSPAAHTAANNASTLKKIAFMVTGQQDTNNISTAVLTADLAKQYGSLRIPLAGQANIADIERSQRSVRSDLRQARSLFKPDLLPVYESLNLPDLSGFTGAYVCQDPLAYREEHTPGEIAIMQSGAELASIGRPELFNAWALGYYCALRASEIAALRWSWFKRAGDNWEIEIRKRIQEHFDPKGYSGWVPVHASVYRRLVEVDEWRPYLLPGNDRGARSRIVVRDLAAWMRSKGWSRRHCSHELRAYRGNVWRHTYGDEVMRDWLRHSSVRVGLRHYTVNHNTSVAPLSD